HADGQPTSEIDTSIGGDASNAAMTGVLNHNEFVIHLRGRNRGDGPVYIYDVELSLPGLEWPKHLLETPIEVPPRGTIDRAFTQPIHYERTFERPVEGTVRIRTSTDEITRRLVFTRAT
ncbi:MAG: hypothetical protein ACQETB_07570, partial [Halobacteriota archaeon]